VHGDAAAVDRVRDEAPRRARGRPLRQWLARGRAARCVAAFVRSLARNSGRASVPRAEHAGGRLARRARSSTARTPARARLSGLAGRSRSRSLARTRAASGCSVREPLT